MTQPKQIRLLLIEDDGGIANVIKLGLRDLGITHTIDHAFTAEEALALFHEHHYDLLLSDYNLRGKNGLDLIREIKQEGSTIPTVLVTAYDTATIRREATSAGVNRFVSKPFFIDEFIDLVRSLIPAQASELGL
ncbi:response regulator [Chloroflexia bacterium SDU3-3]|nr:response regulator [Chloroflexia bacterium SDU3-3]